MKARFPAVLFVCGTLFTSTAAYAEGFIGVGLSNNSYAYSDLDNSNGHKIFGGYYMQDGVFVEVARIDLGDTESDIAPIGLEISGFAAYVGYRNEVAPGFHFFGKAGLYSVDSEFIDSGSSIAERSGSGLGWGLGLSYAFNKTFAVRGELEQLVAVEDFADDESVTGFSISVELRF